MFRRITSILLVFSFSSFLIHPVSAQPLEITELVTPETIATQMVKTDDQTAPHAITGEALVGLIGNMVDFDITGSTIVFNRASGQLVVKNTPGNLEEIEKILTHLRNAALKQVEIETRIITISYDDIDNKGVDALVTEAISQWGKDGVIDFQVGDNDQAFDEVVFPDTTQRNSSSKLGQEFVFSGINKDGAFGASYDAVRSVADVNTLSAPKITTYNNQRANIQIKDLVAYVAEVDAEIRANEDNVFFDVETIVRDAPSGTILDVTPTINNDGTITLEIHPTFLRADLTSTTTVGTVETADNSSFTNAASASNTLTLPTYTEQKLDTTIVIPDGGVAVLGGLIDETETVTHFKVPLLGDIPILGKLFKNDQSRRIKSHLVMFIKATSKSIDESGRIVR